MSNTQVKFVNRKDGGWRDETYEHDSFDVFVKNKDVENHNVGMLWFCQERGWRFHFRTPTYMNGFRLEYESQPSIERSNFNQAKKAIRQLLS